MCLAMSLRVAWVLQALSDFHYIIYKQLKASGIRGTKLFLNFNEVILLMFANDIALISHSIHSLQRQLNILHKFCIDEKLQ